MKKEFTAKTVEEAKALAAEDFGVEQEKITFTVIEEPKKGLFLTKGEAKVEAEYEETKEEAAASPQRALRSCSARRASCSIRSSILHRSFPIR